MKRIVCLMVAVLVSALVLHAEDAAKANSTAGSARYYECVPESENRAVCDQTATNTDSDAAPVADGNVKDAAQNNEPQHMGANLGSTEKQNKQKVEWAPFDYN